MAGLTSSFVYGMGLQPAGIIHSNLASDTHILIFKMRLANQLKITGVDLCLKKFGRIRFTETHAIRYQPSVSVHNAKFPSQCHTTHKGSNKIYYNNITLPTNIRYLKTHVNEYNRRPQKDAQTE
jgi:hypothetical protein